MPISTAPVLSDHDLRVGPQVEAIREFNEFRQTYTPNWVIERLDAGEFIPPFKLMSTVCFGTEAEHCRIRELLAQPEAQSRNQDLVLPHMKALISGEPKALEFWLAHRVTLTENMPTWGQEAWLHGPWHKIDLFCDEVTHYIKVAFHRFGNLTSVRDDCRYMTFDSSDPKVTGSRDLGASSILAQVALFQAEHYVNEIGLSIPQSEDEASRCFEAMREEVEGHRGSIFSTTIVGKLCRQAFLTETHALLATFLLDDAFLALGIPLNSEARVKVWSQTFGGVDKIIKHKIFQDGPALVARMREIGLTEEEIEDRISKAVLTAGYRRLQREIAPQQQQAPSMKLLNGSAPTEPEAEIQLPAARRSLRGLYRAALESSGYIGDAEAIDRNTVELQIRQWSRLLEKVTNGRDDLLTIALCAIEKRCDVDKLIDQLRTKRREGHGYVDRKSESFTESRQSVAAQPALRNIAAEDEPVRVSWEYEYSTEARRRMADDGRLRHAAEILLADYQERPELYRLETRKRRIDATDGVWELKASHPEIRVYIRHQAAGHVYVVNVGYKKTQDRDIADLR